MTSCLLKLSFYIGNGNMAAMNWDKQEHKAFFFFAFLIVPSSANSIYGWINGCSFRGTLSYWISNNIDAEYYHSVRHFFPLHMFPYVDKISQHSNKSVKDMFVNGDDTNIAKWYK